MQKLKSRKRYQATRPTITTRVSVNLATMILVALSSVKLLHLSVLQQTATQALYPANLLALLQVFSGFRHTSLIAQYLETINVPFL